MTYQISDTFSSLTGDFEELAPWDGTEHSDAAKGFLATQSHVDIRNFRVYSDLVPVPQAPDLEDVTQTVLDDETQEDMEEKLGNPIVTENWVLAGTGLTSLVVGPIDGKGGWAGAVMSTNGSAVNATLTSLMADAPVDISAMDDVCLILPDDSDFDTTTTKIQFTSDTAATFGNGHDSVAIELASSLDPMPEWRFAVADLANSGFDNTHITGVKITFKRTSAPSNGLVVSVLAIRAIVSAWTESALDLDTRLGALVVPVTLSGDDYSDSTAKNFEFVRGDGTKLDPIPADEALYLYFYPGGSTTPNEATDTGFNKIGFIVREQKDTDDGTGSHIQIRLLFNDGATSFEVANVSSTGGSPGTVTDTVVYSEDIGPALDPLKHYVLRGEVRGTAISAALYETDVLQAIGDFLWQPAATITDDSFTWKNGRVGFIAELLTRDAYVAEFNVAPTGYAEMITGRYVSRSIVDGAQIAAVYSPDDNLFDTLTSPAGDLFIDQTKTLSGLGSFRTQHNLQTNDFGVDDWTQMYLNLAIWVPTNVTLLNQPTITLESQDGLISKAIDMPRLQPSQWNALEFDLGIFRNLITAASYHFFISQAPNPDRSLGYFWVDELTVGRRRVAWSVRATSNGAWREFKSVANDPSGAVHFTPEERGNQLQLKAVALTPDAWISSFKLFPRYAQLGLPVWDQGFASR